MVVINLYCYGNIQMQKISIFKYCASLAIGLALSSNLCASYTIETFVGDGTTGLSGDGGPATTASLNCTQAVCVDSLGNIYAADTNNNRIRKISPSGIISTIAGTGTAGYSGDGGLATNAALINPYSICVDSSKNLYFSDYGNNVIRMISAGTNIISTIAGTGIAGYSGDGGAATAAMLSNPFGVFVDNTGYIYVADSGNFRVRRFTLGGTISTIAGDGAATTLSNPTSVYVDNAGRVFISEDGNNRIRMFSGGVLTTIAGGGTGGDGGPATSASLSGPRGIFGDSAGNIYFADTSNQRIRRFTPGGIINTIAGNGTAGFSGDGGSATAAMLRNPYGVFVSNTGSIYIADTFNNRIRRFDIGGNITTIAGDGTTGASGDGGIITYADLNSPRGGSFDSTGNLYFADTLHNRIRKIAAGTNIISTIAGSGIYGFSGDGGPATAALFNSPQWVYVDGAGAIYIADTGNSRIRKIDAGSNIISTIAGGGAGTGIGDGLSATSARLASPQSVFVDSSGAIYIADTNNNRIRKIDAGSNIISTIAGGGAGTDIGDGLSATSARLASPQAVFVDSSGAIYIADTGNSRIRKITAGSNIISTIAGNGTAGFSGDGGLSTAAMINSPRAIFQDSSGDIYIADQVNNRIRKIAAGSNIISTIAGNGTAGFSGDGGVSTAAMINSPRAIFQDNLGRIYLSDSRNNRIRRLALTAPATSLTIEVNGTDRATVSAALAATTVRKTGSGTAVLSGNNSAASTLQFNAGLVQVSATNNMGASLAFAGGNMKVTSGTVAVPTAAMTQAGRITTNSGAAVSSIAAPSGTSLLTIAGPGVVTAGDMSASTTPLSIPGVMYVGASSSSKMPTGVATVLSGGLVKIMGATASSVPGATEIQSGGILEVLASVAVPDTSAAADIFGTLKFNSGSILKLGAGASWARNMRIGTAL